MEGTTGAIRNEVKERALSNVLESWVCASIGIVLLQNLDLTSQHSFFFRSSRDEHQNFVGVGNALCRSLLNSICECRLQEKSSPEPSSQGRQFP